MTRRGRVPTLAVTAGEPAGIGPDLCAALAARRTDCRVVLIGDRTLYGRVRGRRALARALPDYEPGAPARRRVSAVWVLVSSTKTRSWDRRAATASCQADRAASSRSVAISDFF